MTAPEATRPDIGLWTGLRTIYAAMSPGRRQQLLVVLALMFAGAFAELGTFGSVVPFLSLITDPQKAAKFPWARSPAIFGSDRLASAALLFCAFAILAGVTRLQLMRSTQNFAYAAGNDLTVDIERRLLLQPYSFHVSHSSSKLLAALGKTEDLVYEVLLPSMQALVATFLAVAIVGALLYIDPLPAFAAAAAFAAVYIGISAAAGKSLARNSEVIAHSLDERMKIAQESLGAIRDVIIDGTQDTYVGLFERVSRKLYLARANTAFIALAPRFVIETAGMVLIAAIAVLIGRSGGLAATLPELGAIVLGAQRLLPLLQQIYSAASTARGQRAILGDIVEVLRLPCAASAPANDTPALAFRKSIRINRVSFTYPTRRNRTLEDVTLEVPCGSALAIIGETGSGKSTLADLIMGLLNADAGSILVDGVALTPRNCASWQRNISHVPQSIFLADASIAQNIALATEAAPDSDRVVAAAKQAQLHEFIVSLPDGYETFVGERGIRLSGGQRQRLGIARAIYKNAPLLVLDEATSALDDHTEMAVITALENLRRKGCTLIIIAHRLSTIRHCDLIARLEQGRIGDVGSYARVVGRQDFRSSQPLARSHFD